VKGMIIYLLNYIQRLENGLMLRALREEKDVRSYADFNTKYNNPYEGATCSCLINHHPLTGFNDYQFIEDERTGQIVSTTCLIPWSLEFEGIELQAAMLEMVLTHPEYRKLGLVKAQIARFLQVVEERKFDLSIIWGIPYYYRQYGYTYCIEGNSSDSLPIWRIPGEASGETSRYTLRVADEKDIEELTAFYNRSMKDLDFFVQRSHEYWLYLIKHAKFPVWMVKDNITKNSSGYLIMKKSKDNRGINIIENGICDYNTGLGVLKLLKNEVSDEIVLNWPENNVLVKLARCFGSIPQNGGQWLLRIHNITGFLAKIAPALEKRLDTSGFKDVSTNLTINFFRQAYILHINKGKITAIDNAGFIDSSMGSDGGDLCIPPEAFVRLVFGFRSVNQLRDAWPDLVVKPEVMKLVEALFPQIESYISTPYHFII
jgi:predicted acetyltransferase